MPAQQDTSEAVQAASRQQGSGGYEMDGHCGWRSGGHSGCCTHLLIDLRVEAAHEQVGTHFLQA